VQAVVGLAANLNVRSSASTSGTIVATEQDGDQGTIVGGPVSANGYTWWQVQWNDGANGWSVEQYLADIAETPAPPGPAPSPSPSPIPPPSSSGGVGADGKTFDQRRDEWIASPRMDNSPQGGRQHILAWVAAGTHATCRSVGDVSPNTPCLKTAEGFCSGLYIDDIAGVEKIVDPYGGGTTYNDLQCVSGNIPGLIAWKDQSGSFAPATLARLYLQYNYPNAQLKQLFKDIVGDGNFLDSSPSDTQGSRDMQPLMTAVHYLAAMKDPNGTTMYVDRGASFSRTFTYNGRTYTPGSGPHNALTFTRDWLFAQMDEILKQPNAETNSASYQSRAISAWRLLYDFGEPDMRIRAKMSLDALFLDAGMQFSLGANQWGGLLGRTYRGVYEGGWSDTMPWHVYWGAKSSHYTGLEGLVSSYRLPALVEQMPHENGSEWLLKRDSYRNNTFATESFVLAAGPDGKQDWRVVLRRGDGGYPMEFWINDFAGDLDSVACSMGGQTVNGRTISTCGGGECYSCLGAGGSLYRNNILLEGLSNPVMHLSSGGQAFDQAQGKLQATNQWLNEYWMGNGQWNYYLEGNTAIAVHPGPGTGGIEIARIDPGCSEDFCYSSWSAFTSAPRSIGNGSFTNGKGVVIDRNKTYARAPGRLMASAGDNASLVTWSGNVMTVSRGGQACAYDFNSWTYSGSCN
jgi:hypothetical protein